MLTSLWVAADSLGISQSQANNLCQEFLRA